MIEAGADVNLADKDGQTPLFRAALKGHIFRDVLTRHIESVKALIDAGADVNQADNVGRNPLDMASSGGHIEVVRMLIDAGAVIEHI